ncbi:hypothetical protein JYA63_08340 [Fictibacillus nanhaiensis]|uniref:Uncharacterized protein n=1 Tax=Fictibacillus nanhaiensis TaxID=742169 RepID=A0ABS2ZN18_9BACL|nr:hypothetical protein [Fictibacillus nanhaiensis]
MVRDLILRKGFVSALSTLIFSFIMILPELPAIISTFDLGLIDFVRGILFYCIFAGGIIFTYGNLVSVLLETMFFKNLSNRKKSHYYLYILLHGIGGVLFGLLIGNGSAALVVGGFAAILYGLLDVWTILKLKKEDIASY